MHIRWRKLNVHLKIRTQFFLLLASAVFLCALLIGGIASVLFTREIEQKAIQSGNELLGSATARLSKYMQDLDGMAYPLMFNKAVQSVLSSIGRPDTSAYFKYTAQNNCTYALQLQAGINPDIEIAVFPLNDATRWYSSQSENRSTYNFRAEDWYRDFSDNPALRKQYLPNQTIAIYIGSEREPAHLIVYRVNSVYSTRTVGYMCVYLRPAAIERMLSNFSENIRDLTLEDGNGEAIFAVGAVFSSGDLLALHERLTSDTIFTHDGRPYMLLARQVEGVPWRIVCVYDLSASQREARRINLIIFLATIGACVLCVPVLWRFLVRLLKPVEQLTIGMEWVKMGRMDFKLESSRKDELGQALNNFNDMILQLDQAHRNLSQMAELQREISISALRQQINPHFLYNTLDMIIGMTTEGDRTATIEVCKALGGMFRYNLNGDYMVQLRHELTQTRRYIQISQYRFRNRFEVTYSVNEELLDQVVPKLILQPIVENCVIHGFATISRAAVILIAIDRAGPGRFYITVKDNGAGMPAAELQTLRDSLTTIGNLVEGKSHIGIRNVYARLYLVYGREMSMDIESQSSVGTQITILLPVK